MKSSDVYVSMRRAVSQAHKLVKATSFFNLSPIEEVWIEVGTILWNAKEHVPIPSLDLSTQPEPSGPPVHEQIDPTDRRYWDSDDFINLFKERYDGRLPTATQLIAFIEKEAPSDG